MKDLSATTPSKGSKKDKKEKKSKKGEKATNGDDGDHDRASPEINSQEQMAAQRASGGEILAPPAPEVCLSYWSFIKEKSRGIVIASTSVLLVLSAWKNFTVKADGLWQPFAVLLLLSVNAEASGRKRKMIT